MPEKNNNTAILVFIRSPKHEAKEKVFAKHIGFQGNQKLASKLNKRIVSLSEASGIPTFIFDSSKQFGFTFGERFVNAFESVFSKGFEKVIAVGNDCLSMNQKTLLKAKEELQRNELILGPTFDGGYYLIGVSRKIFKSKLFENFNWTTAKLANDFKAFVLKNNVSTSYLETEYDVDNESALYQALKELPKLYFLRKIIEKLLSISSFHIFNFCNRFANQNQNRFIPLRAPPRVQH